MSETQNPKSSANSKSSASSIVYFRKRTSRAAAFLVYVEEASEIYCSSFESLDEALDFMETKEDDLAVACHLFQNLIVEEF